MNNGHREEGRYIAYTERFRSTGSYTMFFFMIHWVVSVCLYLVDIHEQDIIWTIWFHYL